MRLGRPRTYISMTGHVYAGTNAHKLCKPIRHIRWNREESAAVITAAGCGGRRYPVKVAILKDKINKFNCVALYDPKNKELDESDSDNDVDLEPSLPTTKISQCVAATP